MQPLCAPLIRHWRIARVLCSPHRTRAGEAHVKQLMGEGESATASSLVCVSHRRAAGNAASEIRRTTNLAFWHRDLSCRRCGERFPPPPATRVTNAMIAPRHLHTHPPSTPWPNLLSSVLVLVLIQYVLCRQAQKVRYLHRRGCSLRIPYHGNAGCGRSAGYFVIHSNLAPRLSLIA